MGIIVLARETRSFEDLMEEKLNKVGQSWKNPGKRIKLVNQPPEKKPVFAGNLFINTIVKYYLISNNPFSLLHKASNKLTAKHMKFNPK
jgi:hypothetical protein